MGSRLRSPTLLFSLAAIIIALLAGAVIPLSGGPLSGGGQLDWTPPAPVALTATAQAAHPTPTPILATLAAPTATTPATAPIPTKPPATAPTAVVSTAAPTTTAPTTVAPAPSPTAHTRAPGGAANATIPTRGINLRSGPGTSFYVIATAKGGEQFTATGRSADSQWVQLCCVGPDRVWASVDYVELTGNLEDYPIVEQ